MPVRFTAHALATLIALGAAAPCQPAVATWFRSAWSSEVDRTWIGPAWFANRLQDWRLRDGRVECVTSDARHPLRTAHLLTHTLGFSRRTAINVEIGAVDPRADGDPDSWAGILIGAGGAKIDYRLTALVHHRPAEDGGLLIVVDGSGRVAFRDNSRGTGRGGLWSVAGALGDNEVPEIESTSRQDPGVQVGRRGSVRLSIVITSDRRKDRAEIVVRALDDSDNLVSTATASIDRARLDGSIAIVSHGGPRGSDAGFWFRDLTVRSNSLQVHHDRGFGPVLCAMHTLSGGVLKLTAQMGPLGSEDTRVAQLDVRDDPHDYWRTVAVAKYRDDSCTFPFRVDGWDGTRSAEYRIVYELAGVDRPLKTHYYGGTIRAEPRDADAFVMAALTCNKVYTGGLRWNHNGIWHPHAELVAAVEHHDPDLLYFSGDQIYEGDLTGVVRRPVETATLDYLYKWYRWCWAFRDLARDRPCITIPDDHDVYHGNLWGAGGRRAVARDGMTAQDSGGYTMPARFVNAVHATQTSHLPDPVDPEPIGQGISVYTTRVDYAGISFAVIADRQWKSSPTVAVPEGRFVNGWSRNPDFDPAADADVPDAILLGERQLSFLDAWGRDWSDGTWMKVALSQSIFANLATLPAGAESGSVIPNLPTFGADEYPVDYRLTADADSNGWPQTGRNRAVRSLRRALALHIAGDQHLGAVLQYGLDDWRDAAYAFSTPSIANTWPRRWYPPTPGLNRAPDAPRYCGDFRDGFGNRMTVEAVANPIRSGREPSRLYDRAPGYGIVRFDRRSRDVTFECWPRWVDPAEPGATQYPGWPVVINQVDNAGREHALVLRPIFVRGMTDAVVQVIDEDTDAIVYTLRIAGTSFRPWVERPGVYTIRVGEPGTSRMRTITGLRVEDARPPIEVDFTRPE